LVDLADKAAGVDVMKNEWALGLSGLTGEQIKAAIEHHRTRSTWPPSISEFRAAAKGHASAEQIAYQRAEALPADTRAEQLAKGAAEAAKLRDREHSPTRTLKNIERGIWTRDHERHYAKSAGILGLKLEPVQWPDEIAA
jgi:hypothetical protein